MEIGSPGTIRAGMNEEQDPRRRQVLPDARNKHIVPIASDSPRSETPVAEEDGWNTACLDVPAGNEASWMVGLKHEVRPE